MYFSWHSLVSLCCKTWFPDQLRSKHRMSMSTVLILTYLLTSTSPFRYPTQQMKGILHLLRCYCCRILSFDSKFTGFVCVKVTRCQCNKVMDTFQNIRKKYNNSSLGYAELFPGSLLWYNHWDVLFAWHQRRTNTTVWRHVTWGSFYEMFMSSCLKSCKNSIILFRITGLLCREFTGHRWIPHTKASDEGIWCFLWSAPEPTVGQTVKQRGCRWFETPSCSIWRHRNE